MFYTLKDNQLILRIFLQPEAKVDEIVGVHSDYLKIKIKAPAIEGKANGALLKFLADLFKVPQKNVVLLKGKQSKYKQVLIRELIRLPDVLCKFFP